MYNKVVLMGNLCRDPELRYTTGGTAVASFSLAVNKKWKDAQSGEAREKVTFVDVTAFKGRGETISQWFKKGDPILMEGELSMDEWEDKNTGQKRTKLKVILNGFTFLPARKQRDGEPTPQTPQRERPDASDAPPPIGAGAKARQAAAEELPPIEDDDIPF